MTALGARRFVCTDIGRDGMLQGPNLEHLREIAACTSSPVVASGGVATVADIAALRGLPVEGVIVGKALYAGSVQLPEALEAARG
ncbi:MAG: HisA/HisF-related TIM barrel protein, partial [Chloroflexi bacterium]|nr:HisA/HisF-related TIM barrel protein [Chloroflexota bacterium]